MKHRVVFSRRVRVYSAFLLLLLLLRSGIDRWVFNADVPWYLSVVEAIVALSLVITALSSFVRLSDTGVTSYLGLGRLESAWQNVEGVRQIEIGGRKVRCLVFRTRVHSFGWYWSEEWSVPRAFRGRLVQIPEGGPLSYHEDAQLIDEVENRLLSTSF